MRSDYLTITLFIEVLGLVNAIPTCPLEMISDDFKIDDQQNLDQSINHLTSVPYDQSRCVTLTVSYKENYTYKIDLLKLLKIQSNFVMIGQSLKQVRLDCTGNMNDTGNPLSGLEYVGFYRMAFYDCKIPLLIENVTHIDIEEVTFSGSKEGAVNIFNCHNINIVNCSFENNNSTGQFARKRFQGSSGGLSIGMYRDTAAQRAEVSVVVHSCSFINNQAHAFGSNVHTATSFLSSNIITGRGAGMSLTIDSNNAVRSYVTYNHFEKNTARVYGGGLYFLVNEVTKNQTYLFSENIFINNQALLTSGAMIYGLVGMVYAGSSINVKIFRNYFEGNMAQLGGAFRFQRPTGNQGNYLVFNNCTFNRNMAIENGAAIGISKAQFFNFDQRTIPITIANCTFSENYSLRGGTVFSAYTAVAFNDSNSFIRNQGVALNLLASTVKFYGLVEFIDNNVQKFDGGALYMTSFSQMILYDGANLNFINNTGSFGAAIVVEVLSRLTHTIFGTTNLCFMQYHNISVSPHSWMNVSINFTGNEAIIGSAVYINNAQHCVSNSNDDIDDALFDWPFMHYSINNNTGQINGTDQKFYVQTPLTRFDITDNMVETFPGESFPLTVTSSDLSNLPAAGILQLTLQNNSIGLNPSAIILTPIHQSYGFTYDITNGFAPNMNIEVTVRAFRSTSQVESPNSANIEVTMLPCPPGNVLHNECQCDTNDVFIVDCFENYTAIILHLGLWGYSISGSRLGYYQCPLGYCQCTEVNQNGNTLCSSVYNYNASNQQCNCDRTGTLCGHCTDGAGVTVLLNRCAHCSSTNAILIGAIVLMGIVIASVLLLCSISLPEWLYPFLFYIQVTGYVTDGYQTSFSYLQQTNLYISSALSLYFPYDFCLFSGMTSLVAYSLRYIPLTVSVFVLLTILCIKSFKSSKCAHIKISSDGLWILIILVYSHTLHTSLSILHCPQVGDSNGNKKTAWFVDGTVECFTGGHAVLAIFAIVILVLFTALMIFTLAVSLKIIKGGRWAYNLSVTLTKSYKYKWWSTVELLRRYLIILFIVTIPGNHAPSILLLMAYIPLYGYVQPFMMKPVNVLEFAFLVDILLLQMIKSTSDIQNADFSDVIEYQRDCGKAIRVERFAFTLMTLLLYIPMAVTLLLILVCGGMKLKSRIVHLFKYKPVERSRRDSLTWSYAITATAAASSYLLITDDDVVHLTSQADTYS